MFPENAENKEEQIVNFKHSEPLKKYLNQGKSEITKASENDTPQKPVTRRSTIELPYEGNSVISFNSPFKSIDGGKFSSAKNVIESEYYNCSTDRDMTGKAQWIDFSDSIDITTLDLPDSKSISKGGSRRSIDLL